MKRTKEWWNCLSKDERSKLVMLERAYAHEFRYLVSDEDVIEHDSYLPADSRECPYCSTPHLSFGLCPTCVHDLIALIEKANNKMEENK